MCSLGVWALLLSRKCFLTGKQFLSAAKKQSLYCHCLGKLNTTIATLLTAVSDYNSLDYVTAEKAAATISDYLPHFIEVMKSVTMSNYKMSMLCGNFISSYTLGVDSNDTHANANPKFEDTEPTWSKNPVPERDAEDASAERPASDLTSPTYNGSVGASGKRPSPEQDADVNHPASEQAKPKCNGPKGTSDESPTPKPGTEGTSAKRPTTEKDVPKFDSAESEDIERNNALLKIVDIAQELMKRENYEVALSHLNYYYLYFNPLLVAPATRGAVACKVKLMKAECLAMLGRSLLDAKIIATEQLSSNKNDIDATYVLGLCFYRENNLDKSFRHFQQVLRLDPDHKKALEMYKKIKEMKSKTKEEQATPKFNGAKSANAKRPASDQTGPKFDGTEDTSAKGPASHKPVPKFNAADNASAKRPTPDQATPNFDRAESTRGQRPTTDKGTPEFSTADGPGAKRDVPEKATPNDESTNNERIVLKKLHDDAQKAMKEADYDHALSHMDHYLKLKPSCITVKFMKAECLAMLGRYQEAKDIAAERKNNIEATYVLGLCFYEENIDKAFRHFQQVLRRDSDHKKAMEMYKKIKHLRNTVEEGNNLLIKGRWLQALNIYNDALAMVKNSKQMITVYFNKATACIKLNQNLEAMKCYTQILNMDENDASALSGRAACYIKLKEYEEAVEDYEKLYAIKANNENKELLENAKLLERQKRTERKNFYKILCVNKSASENEIKEAYRRCAKLHHPDRHANAAPRERRRQERLFKEIAIAYETLGDRKKRAIYDRGAPHNTTS